MISNKKIISDILLRMSKCYIARWTVILLDDDQSPVVTRISLIEKPDAPLGTLTNPEIKELTGRILNLFKRFQRQTHSVSGLRTTLNSVTYEWDFAPEWIKLIVSFERK